MDLSLDAIFRVVHPTAGLSCHERDVAASEKVKPDAAWEESQLNPKNRIDSLAEVRNPTWRIDGCAGMGTQFYTVPLFLSTLEFARVDTFIPEQSQISSGLRELLDLNTAFHCKDSRASHLGISRHILRTLELWSRSIPNIERVYADLPFGSRIVFENLEYDIRKISVRVVKTHYLEHLLLSQQALQKMWQLPSTTWPTLVDVSNIRFVQQLHDSISVVRIGDDLNAKPLILKALISSPQFLYHELKILLTLSSHPNIIDKPLHLVTKRCRWGAKTAIVGFTLPYHQQGTLRDILPFQRIHKSLVPKDQLKWGRQLTSALIHINEQGLFYSDLRLDNILLSDSRDLVLVDFEQRGVWCGFSAPEVSSLDYLHMLACENDLSSHIREKYGSLLDRYVPEWRAATRGQGYRDPSHGYAVPWLALSRDEREAAQVFMLGRVLWCIFECKSSPEIAVWQSYRFEEDLEFPNFRLTPNSIRNLIQNCVKGSRAGRETVIRKGGRLVLRDGDGTETAEEVEAEAIRWWKAELDQTELALERRYERRMRGDFSDVFGRPKLVQVMEELARISLTL